MSRWHTRSEPQEIAHLNDQAIPPVGVSVNSLQFTIPTRQNHTSTEGSEVWHEQGKFLHPSVVLLAWLLLDPYTIACRWGSDAQAPVELPGNRAKHASLTELGVTGWTAFAPAAMVWCPGGLDLWCSDSREQAQPPGARLQ